MAIPDGFTNKGVIIVRGASSHKKGCLWKKQPFCAGVCLCYGLMFSG